MTSEPIFRPTAHAPDDRVRTVEAWRLLCEEEAVADRQSTAEQGPARRTDMLSEHLTEAGHAVRAPRAPSSCTARGGCVSSCTAR